MGWIIRRLLMPWATKVSSSTPSTKASEVSLKMAMNWPTMAGIICFRAWGSTILRMACR
ncbi:hypothetical protein DSECCO2_619120 [anaerobic digester metagenome]